MIIGNGLGYFTNAIQKYIDLDIKIIIIEPSIEIFKYCLHSTEMTEVFKDSRFEFLINDNVEEIEIELRHILRQPDSNINLNLLDVYHYSDISPQFYSDLTLTLNNLVDYELDIYRKSMLKFKENHSINLIHNHIAYCNESLKNLKYLFETNSPNNFKNIFKNKPAIIVSAGPSLTKTYT